MDKYLINDLERLTGVKAHTIRIWEKRYSVIEPSRTGTNRRYYSSEQLKRLMNISTLLSHGHKISHVAALPTTQLNDLVEALYSSDDNQTVYAVFVHNLTEAMFSFNEPQLDVVASEAIERFGFQQAMVNIFYPFLSKTGLMWRVDKAMPAEEHFAVNLIRKILITSTHSLPVGHRTDKKFLLFLPPSEWHELGLLFANYLVRAAGYQTVYLGQNVPTDEVRIVAEKTECAHILCFYVASKPTEEVHEEVRQIAKENKKATIYACGREELIGGLKVANVKLLSTVEALLNIL